MKILHTSDWHIGKRLYSKKRFDEFESFFIWLIETIEKESIDILLVSGDVFDTTTPGNRSQQIYYNFLRSVNKTCCSNVVITGGNHDSPTFLNAPSMILKELNINVMGSVSDNLEDEVLLLKNNRNEEVIICAVPYLRERDIRVADPGESIKDKEINIIEGIKKHYRDVFLYAKTLQKKDTPIIATGHLFTTGGKTLDDDGVRDLYIGTIGHVGHEIFPKELDYLALGHLHISQKIGGLDNFRYSGSPIPMGFGEADQNKKVITIEFMDKKRSIKEIEVPIFRKLKRVKGDILKLEKEILLISNLKEDIWLEVIYEGKDLVPNLRQKIDDYVKNTRIEVLRIKNRRIIEKIESDIISEKGLDELDCFEVFDKCLDANGIEGDLRRDLKISYHQIINFINEEDVNSEKNENS